MNIAADACRSFILTFTALDTREQIIAAGLESYLVRPRGVAVVEWIERWLGNDGVPGAGKYRRVANQNHRRDGSRNIL